MPITLDCVPAEYSFCQRRTFVWTEIAGGIEFATYIEQGEFSTVGKVNSGNAARGEVFYAANRNGATFLPWWICVREFSIE